MLPAVCVIVPTSSTVSASFTPPTDTDTAVFQFDVVNVSVAGEKLMAALSLVCVTVTEAVGATFSTTV